MEDINIEQAAIVEGNKAIAKYMGDKIVREFDGNLQLSSDGGKSWYGKLYNEDWNALMPVVEKCYKIYKKSNHIDTSLKLFYHIQIYHPIGKVWLAVVEFIKFWNNEKAKS